MRIKEGGFLKAAVAILILLNMGMMFAFWQNQKPKRGKKLQVPTHLFKEIGFNEEQTEKFKDLFDEHGDDTWIIKEEIRDARLELFKLLSNKDVERYEELMDEIAELQKEQMESLFKHFEEVRALCENDEQRKRFDKVISRGIPGTGGPPHGPPPHGGPKGPPHGPPPRH